MLRMNRENVVLCGKGKCCPEVKQIDENTFEIIDDEGNKIRVTKEQLMLIPDAVKVLGGEQLILG
jgi:hypothetical protein